MGLSVKKVNKSAEYTSRRLFGVLKINNNFMKTLSLVQMTEIKGGMTQDNNNAAGCFVAGATAGLTCALIPWVGALVMAGTTSACLIALRHK